MCFPWLGMVHNWAVAGIVQSPQGAEVVVEVVDIQGGLGGIAEVPGTRTTYSFKLTDVAVIAFTGNDGDDLFMNFTALRSKASGGAGDDLLMGGSAKDTFSGGIGDDVLLGGAGDDLLMGGGDNDLIMGQEGADVVQGGDGDDDLWGGTGVLQLRQPRPDGAKRWRDGHAARRPRRRHVPPGSPVWLGVVADPRGEHH